MSRTGSLIAYLDMDVRTIRLGLLKIEHGPGAGVWTRLQC